MDNAPNTTKVHYRVAKTHYDPLWDMNWSPDDSCYVIFHRNGDIGDSTIHCKTWIDSIQIRDLLRASYGEVEYDPDYIRRLASRSERWPYLPERAKEFASHWRIPGVLPDEQTTSARYGRFEESV